MSAEQGPINTSVRLGKLSERVKKEVAFRREHMENPFPVPDDAPDNVRNLSRNLFDMTVIGRPASRSENNADPSEIQKIKNDIDNFKTWTQKNGAKWVDIEKDAFTIDGYEFKDKTGKYELGTRVER